MKEKTDEEQLKKELKEAIAPHIEKINSHPLVKKYGIFTGLLLGVIVVALFFNNSMIGIGGVETKDIHVNPLGGVGGSVETKSSQGDMNLGIGSNRVNSKNNVVSEGDNYAMQGQVLTVQVYNVSAGTNQIQSLQSSNENNGNKYAPNYDGSNLTSSMAGALGYAMQSTVSWVDLCVLLLIVGTGLAIIMGVLFKISRLLGLG